MQLQGRIKVLNTEQQVSASFRKRELVVTTDEQYPQHIMVEFQQDKCDLLNSFKVGEIVKVSINIRGREWVSPQGEVKHFNTITGWRIERESYSADPAPQQQASAVNAYMDKHNSGHGQASASEAYGSEEEHDDLPF